ncbi:uncharacterized protein LOC110259411 [Sus scrofa]|uniref:uncharacterized protein LOC110259411 n=1 Tax=Sus scrofa TaxID=9823 RepID=UPI000A2B0FD6|nr:uncharacterized protein LOC110259411 [Sus scrofa]
MEQGGSPVVCLTLCCQGPRPDVPEKDDQVQHLLPSPGISLPSSAPPWPRLPGSFSDGRSPPAPAVGTDDAQTSQTQKAQLPGRAGFGAVVTCWRSVARAKLSQPLCLPRVLPPSAAALSAPRPRPRQAELLEAPRPRCARGAPGGRRAHRAGRARHEHAGPGARLGTALPLPHAPEETERRAHTRYRALLSRALPRLPPRWAFKQLSDITSQGFFPLSLVAVRPSVPAGRGEREEEAGGERKEKA